jgi:hypothetical protein
MWPACGAMSVCEQMHHVHDRVSPNIVSYCLALRCKSRHRCGLSMLGCAGGNGTRPVQGVPTHPYFGQTYCFCFRNNQTKETSSSLGAGTGKAVLIRSHHCVLCAGGSTMLVAGCVFQHKEPCPYSVRAEQGTHQHCVASATPR